MTAGAAGLHSEASDATRRVAAAPKHFLGIEILRFLCALAVVISHYTGFFYARPGALAADFRKDVQPLYGLLSAFYDHGNFAVSVFWAISGFIFVWKYAGPVHSGAVSARTFAVNRISRLYPLHLATLLAIAALQAAHLHALGHFFVFSANDAYHFLLNVLFISGWGFTKTFSFNAPIWSVSAEIFTYAVFYLIARALVLDARTSAMVLAATVVLYLAALLNRTLALCLMLFFVGGVTYHASAWLADAAAAGRHRLVGPITAAALLGAIGVVAGWTAMETMLRPGAAMILRNFVFIPCLIVVFVNGMALLPLVRAKGLIEALGNVTYSSYLVHFPLQAAAVLATDGLGIPRAIYTSPWALLAFIAATFVLARLVYLGFEMPMQSRMRGALVERGRLDRAAVR